MTKIDIISGFLGAGKTTLIKKLLADAFPDEKLVLIENEFGEINIDGGFLKESGVQISEMSAGCICCSLVGDFHQALLDVQQRFAPDRILIEPSGVGKLSDVIAAVESAAAESGQMCLNSAVTVADALKVKVYMKNFGEFYNDQMTSAGAVLLSRTQRLSQEKLESVVELVRTKNPTAAILTTPWDMLDGGTILSAMERAPMPGTEHDHDHCHEHHDHDHCHDHCHEHDHDHEHHDHDHHCCGHEHHHADEVFQSWGKETPKRFTRQEVAEILRQMDSGTYGRILRAKGIVNGADGEWIEFDYVPMEHELRAGRPDYTGRLCVIGAELEDARLCELFGL